MTHTPALTRAYTHKIVCVDADLAGQLFKSLGKLGIECTQLSEPEGLDDYVRFISDQLVHQQVAARGPPPFWRPSSTCFFGTERELVHGARGHWRVDLRRSGVVAHAALRATFQPRPCAGLEECAQRSDVALVLSDGGGFEREGRSGPRSRRAGARLRAQGCPRNTARLRACLPVVQARLETPRSRVWAASCRSVTR